MIVTITLNPALDKSSTIDTLIPEKKLRCTEMMVEAGGGGINVSKALHKLDLTSLAVFPVGGLNGKLLERSFSTHNIPYKTIEVPGETRENIMIVETSTNEQFRFIMPGGELSVEIIDQIEALLSNLPEKLSVLVASGSLPPGLPDDFYGRLAKLASKMGAKTIIDTSGKPLELALNCGVYLMKPNVHELAKLSGKEELQLNEVDDAALELIHQGACEVFVISLGAAGALLVTKDGSEHIPAPTVKKKSTVGAGDSMVAGMIWMLSQGKPLNEVVRFGVACGTAATMNAGTELFKKEDVFRLYEWINKYADRYKQSLENPTS